MIKIRGKMLLAGIATLGLLGLGAFAAGGETAPGDMPETVEARELSGEISPEETDEEETGTEAPPPLTLETLPHVDFRDMPPGDENYDTVRYVAHYGYLQGVGGGAFQPYEAVDRAAVVTALYRISGETAAEAATAYADVPAGAWYAGAVAWASGLGIAQGVTADTFGPLEPVTRSQLAAMLSRFAASRGIDVETAGDLSAYADGGEVAEYAAGPVCWATEQGLYKVMVADEILPDMPVSRLQLAQALVGLLAREDPLAAEIHAALPAKTAPVSASLANHESIQGLVDAVAKKYGAVGLQVAVVEDGQLTDTYSYGWATKDAAPMTADHKIRSASISKVAVGVAAMILREEGVVSLDDGIGAYWGVTSPVTIRSMLTHTSSIINAGDGVSRSYDSVRSRLPRSGSGQRDCWSYNNYAFAALGMTLELASGQYVDDILDRRFFDLMDVDASFCAGEIENTGLLATVYRYGGGVGRSVAKQEAILHGAAPGATGSPFAGGLTISAADLGKLAGLLTQDGRYEGVQLLSEESVALMETSFPLSDGSEQGMPLRCRAGLYGRETVYYHTGSAYGVYNLFSYDPAAGDGVVVLTTGASGAKDDSGIYAVCSEISEYIYDVLKQ